MPATFACIPNSRLYLYLSLVFLFFTQLPNNVVLAQNANELKADLDDANISSVFPDDSGNQWVNASMPWNQRYTDIQPFGIAYPNTAEQVSIALKAAVKQGLRISARSGGHSYIAGGLGTTNGHFVIDTSRYMTDMEYDEEMGVATIGSGLSIGLVALFLNSHGRAMPHGRCSFVGVGGHSGHGGFGHHSRMWGLFSDVVQEATVVTVDGVIHTTSAIQDPDLFWAIRGASSSFGIVTQIKVQTFPQPPQASIFQYDWYSLPIASATHHLSTFQQYSLTQAPSEFGGGLVLGKGSKKGEISVQLFGGYWGPHDSLDSSLSGYLDGVGVPDSVTLTQGDWFEGLEKWVYLPLNTTGRRDVYETMYAKSLMTPEDEDELMSEETMESFVRYLAEDGYTTRTNWFVEVELYGGKGSAINAIPRDATAFPHRSSLLTFQLWGGSYGGSFPDSGFTFIEGMADSITKPQGETWPWTTYIGYPDDRLDNWQNRYFNSNYAKLRELKSIYDPDNVLSFPLSVELAE